MNSEESSINVNQEFDQIRKYLMRYFGKECYFITLSYNNEFIDQNQAHKTLKEYFDSLNRYKECDLSKTNVIFCAFECYKDRNGLNRIHHHVMMKKCVSEDFIKSSWNNGLILCRNIDLEDEKNINFVTQYFVNKKVYKYDL